MQKKPMNEEDEKNGGRFYLKKNKTKKTQKKNRV